MTVTFRTHTGEIVTGSRLTEALNKVANDAAQLARDIRAEDAYAPHVPEAAKDVYLKRDLEYAEKIRRGEATGFTIWQRVNQALTGECVGFLP